MAEQLWTLPALTIRAVSLGTMDNNVYLLTSRETGAQILIDAADNAPAIMELLSAGARDYDDTVGADDAVVADDAGTPGRSAARLALVVTTHSHWDHVRALAEVVSATGADTAAGAADAADIDVPTVQALSHGDRCGAGDLVLEVIGLRGHTPGSVALLLRVPGGPAHLFTGDSLFPGGVGNTGADPVRFAQLMTDVSERIFAVLDDDTIVHPGHGAGTTLGAERPALPEWRARGW
ncbi:MBL fold metallo-hydrolase [Specibacter sp. RAF43]|uniref:MBL fold metallo-hydrolase n=1 Tax=Specibacter sp. RAF43 TaxID=3233057 RepID=UPI003F9727D3